MNFIRSLIFSSLSLTSINTFANYTPSEAASFLQHNLPRVQADTHSKKYPYVEGLLEPMFSTNKKVAESQGYRNYLNVLNYANQGNPYASYNAGIYMMLNKEKFNFELTDILILLKKGSDGGIFDSKYSLALIYMNKAEDVAEILNKPQESVKTTEKDKKDRVAIIKRDAGRFRELSQQYILELASKGHEKAFLMACNYYVRGEFLPQDSLQAAVCYNNAVKGFNSNVAMGMLVKLYFDDPTFSGIEFEKKGIDLAKKASHKGNTYAMALLGKQLIYPKNLPYSDVEAGTKFLKMAANSGDELAISYMAKYFDGAGRLFIRPVKPVKNGFFEELK